MSFQAAGGDPAAHYYCVSTYVGITYHERAGRFFRAKRIVVIGFRAAVAPDPDDLTNFGCDERRSSGMAKLTRRAALTVLATGGGLLGVGYLLRGTIDLTVSHAQPGMGGMSGADMRAYRNMFMRHGELKRTVEEVPGGVRTLTESDSADLVAELQAHVSAMYTRLDQGAEVSCMSSTLPTLFRRASDYQRQLSYTPKGIAVVETSTDPELTRVIREHAYEVTGFVVDGMPAMMGGMMGEGMMGQGMHGMHG